ncbi:carbohydrate ABC transporter membrane protein 2, CUT1 family [Clostridium cavendishii DSM 21758]|uniref:Carbohydrate ABC transporter membrane protein 2, CUT1 family n=1 Tax=Clostridium cavendishii DSM 21758 TaxID=1121302 RepID=A0A1M6MRF7_9CLOT|nr:carbohydrate ABC transporter permease [Clostridium cavendishii]SHJ85996.1 carbohydrate ABC transporter membrane protein 2, CUT1 family [Clostridium cavendishii DSM 21758]
MFKFKELKKEKELNINNKCFQISKRSNAVINLILAILAALSIIPFIFVVIISLTAESALNKNGYSFVPEQWSFGAYKYLFESTDQVIRSCGVTILVTILGTIIGLILISTYAYALSRKTFAYKKFFTMVIFIPMLFSGGLVSSYLVNTQFLGLKNSIWGLILPICMNSFYIIILRTFFKTSVPDAIIESAKIDGASELRTFFQIVLPISLPGIATIGLFLTLGYWNDWFNAMLYIDKDSLLPLQYLLIRIESSMEFLVNNATKLGVAGVEAFRNLPKESAKMAMVVITTVPIVFAYPFFQKYFVNGLTIGAVKE